MKLLGIILVFILVCLVVLGFIFVAELLISYHDYKEMEERYNKDIKEDCSDDEVK